MLTIVQSPCQNECAYECIEFEDGYYCDPSALRLKDEISLIDSLTVSGDSLTTEYVQEFAWTARRNLTLAVLLNPELVDDNDIMEEFMERDDSLYAKFASIEYALYNPNLDLTETIVEIQNLCLEMDSISNLIDYNDSLFFTGISSLDSLDILDENEDLRSQINVINLDVDSIRDELFDSYQNNLSLIQEQNESLSSLVNEIYEVNEYEINKIGLKMELEFRDSLTTEEIEIVSAIAFQCIYEGGKAVSRARNLYHVHINDSIEFDDSTICASSSRLAFDELETEKNQSVEKMKIYPNPANNVVSLECITNSDYCGNIIVDVLDLTGRKVLSKSIGDFNGVISLDISKLDGGIYLLTIQSKDKIIEFHKLDIVR